MKVDSSESNSLGKKAQGVIAGVLVVAGVTMPTAILGGEKTASGINKVIANQEFIITVPGVGGFSDYEVTAVNGMTFGELKPLLKAPEGWTIEGCYKDQEKSKTFEDDDIITEQTKIFINYNKHTLNVRFHNFDGTLLYIEEVEYGEGSKYNVVPSRTSTEAETFEFNYWANGTSVNSTKVELTNITTDLEVYACYKKSAKQYSIKFNELMTETAKSHISVTDKIGEEISNLNEIVAGKEIRIYINVPDNSVIRDFIVKVANGETYSVSNLIKDATETYLELTVEGEVSVIYAENEKIYFNSSVTNELQSYVKRVVLSENNNYNLVDLEKDSNGSYLIAGDIFAIVPPTEAVTIDVTSIEGARSDELVSSSINLSNVYVVTESVDNKLTFDVILEYNYLNFKLMENGTYAVIGLNKDYLISDETIYVPSIYKGVRVTVIKANAFVNSNVAKIVLPASIVGIENDGSAFRNCNNLKAIEVASDNLEYYSLNGILYSRNNYQTKLVCVPVGKGLTSFDLTGVNTIGKFAFYNSNLTKLIIPKNIYSIGGSAFGECTRLADVTIESSNCYSGALGTGLGQSGGILVNAKKIKVLKTLTNSYNNNYLYSENYVASEQGEYILFNVAKSSRNHV